MKTKHFHELSRAHSGLLTGLVIALLLVSFSRGGFNASSADSKHGYYQRLASAFLKGELAIDEKVPLALQTAENPYDPEINAPFRTYGVHDAVLFENKFYYYWGPGAVVLTVVPAKLLGLTLTETDIGIASVVAIAILLGMIIDLLFVSKRRKFLLTIGLSCNFPLAFLTTRIAIWEAGTLFASAFAILAIYLILQYLNSNQERTLKLFLASFAIAIAISSRTEAGILMLPLLMAAWQSSTGSKDRWIVILKSCAAPLAVVTGLLIYNWMRFGHPIEFGVKKIIGGLDQTNMVFSSLSYIRFNLSQYLFHGWSFSEFFPFLKFQNVPLALKPQGQVPGTEIVVGFFWTHFWIFPLFFVFGRTLGKKTGSSLRAFGFGLIAASAFQFVFLSYAIFSSSERYALMPSISLSVGVLVLLSGREEKNSMLNVTCILAIPSAFLALLGAAHGYYPDRVPANFAFKVFSGALSPFGQQKVGTPIGGLFESDQCLVEVSPGSSLMSIRKQETNFRYFRFELILPRKAIQGFSPIASFGTIGASDVFGISWDGKTARVLRDKWRQSPVLSENISLNSNLHHTLVITSNVLNSATFVFIDGFLVLSDSEGLLDKEPVIGINALQASTVSQVSGLGIRALPPTGPRMCGPTKDKSHLSLFDHCLISTRLTANGVTTLEKSSLDKSSITIELNPNQPSSNESLPLVTSGVSQRGDVVSMTRRGKALYFKHDHWGEPSYLSQPLQLLSSNVLSLTVVARSDETLIFVNGFLALRSTPFYQRLSTSWRVGINDIGATTASVKYQWPISIAKSNICKS